MKVKPTCRYEHGLLLHVPTADDAAWGLVGVQVQRATAGMMRAGDPLQAVFPNDRIFTVRVFRCATCGYIEMFDEDVANE
jgi:hypothetical protein